MNMNVQFAMAQENAIIVTATANCGTDDISRELKMLNDENDNRIVAKILSSKKHMFETLVERYKNGIMTLLYRFLGNREEAEDAAQDTFVRAFKYLKSYDSNAKFSSWLFKIATNCAYKQLSKIRKRSFESLDDVQVGSKVKEPEDISSFPEKVVVDGERAVILQEALAKLPDHYREVLILRFMQDLSYNEISEIMEIPISSVKVNLHRAKARLMKIYKEMESVE